MAPRFDVFAVLATLLLFADVAYAQLEQPQTYYNIRYAHASMGSVIVIIIFPLGGIIIRGLKLQKTVWIHVFCQMFGYFMFCYVFSTGVYMSYQNDYYIDPHIETGIILFGFTTFQMFFGAFHHQIYRRYGRRTYLTYLHILLGRGIITLGMLNGGLGLRLSTGYPIGQIANTAELKAYGIVAGIAWVAYNLIIAYFEVRAVKPPQGDGIEGRKLGVYE